MFCLFLFWFFLLKKKTGLVVQEWIWEAKPGYMFFTLTRRKIKKNCRKIDPDGESLGVWLYWVTDSLFCLPADSPWTCDRSIKAPKMELWWFKHWPSSWWRQWSDLIVRPFLNFYHYFKLIFYFFLLNNLPFYLCSLALKRFSKIRSVEATTFLWVVKLWFSCACSVLAVNDNVFYRFG